MKLKKEQIVIGIVALFAGGTFLFWLFFNPVRDFITAVPGLDHRPGGSGRGSDSVIIGEKFSAFDTLFKSELTGKWPNFRGAEGDNICKEQIKLLDKWPASGPKILWKKELGEGHAAAAVYNGRVYVLDYDEQKKNDVLHCYSLVEGKELWRRSYFVSIKRNHGISRTIPAVNDKYVVTMGPHCQLMCCDALNGKLIWGIDLSRQLKTIVPLWYTGQCPIIDNNVAVVAPGGTALLAGINCADGKILWSTPNPDSLKMSHSSIIPMTLAGKKMYVYNALGGLVGVSAEENDKGKLLWKTTEFSASVIAPSPVFVGNNRIFVTAGYGAGSAVFRVNRNGETFSVEKVISYKPSQGLASEQQTPIFINGLVYNIQTKDAGNTRNQFVCFSPNDFKNVLWTSSKSDRFGLGPYILADNKFYILNDEGEMTIARFSTSKFEVLDKAKIIDGQDAWGPLAVADGMLIMRDSKNMLCVDLRANP